jgi:cell division initiation protein
MKLTPLDIQQQQFRTALMGFDKKEVDTFLDLLANDVEELVRENNALKDEVRKKESDLLEFRERERTLKDTMLTATQITEDIKQNARKEAEIVIAQAEQQAEQIIQNAHTRLVRIMEDMDELRRQKAQFEASLRSMIQTHFKLLDAMGEREGTMGETLTLLRKDKDRKEKEREPLDREDTQPKVLAMRDQTMRTDEELLKPRGGDR